MGERETRDLMSVESLSQLPFIRQEKSHQPLIRLFGFDFPSDGNDAGSANVAASPASHSGNVNPAAAPCDGASRKFECHYCLRNFPTSQALGGHQNAHKRERQHAKRAQLHSSVAAEGHLHGTLFHRLALPSSSTSRFVFDNPPPPPSTYPPWSLPVGSSVGGRFFSGLGTMAQPITGSPLPGIWRGPPTTQFTAPPSPVALFREEDMRMTATVPAATGRGGGRSSSSSLSAASPMERPSHPHELKDGVSLDLHL